MSTRALDYIALILVIVGAVNWGLIGFFGFDLVAFLFGNISYSHSQVSSSIRTFNKKPC